eukprot:jgi/Ulvmu1/9529/UM053_0018.1
MQPQRTQPHGWCSALALAALVCAPCVLAQTRGTVHFKKFQIFFELLDQSGELSAEFSARDGDLCAVSGVTCQNGEVTAIDFSGRGLVGELSKDNYVYENLPQLKRLDLSGNELGYGVAPIPNSVHKLINIEYLDLSDNAFTGEMPTFVIDEEKPFFKKIKHIDLSNNQLRGRVRWNWADLSSVDFIDISGNDLSGGLPESWYSSDGLADIQTLDVSGNNGNMCGDDGAASSAFAARGVSFSCEETPEPAPAPGAVVTGPLMPIFDEFGNPIVDANGNQIFLGEDGQPLVSANGTSLVDADGNLLTDVAGNPVAMAPNGTVMLDPMGDPVFETPEGEPLVTENGTSIIGADGEFVTDSAGNPVLLGPDGDPVTDANGNPIFVGPDGQPLVTDEGLSIVGPDGDIVTDANGNLVQQGPDGEPVTDANGNLIFIGPDGQPLVDDDGLSIVGEDGELLTDANGNPVATDEDGNPVLDPNGNPVFQSPDGTPLVDSSGDSIIGPDGQITQDVDGNPVATNPDGSIQTDANGNPIFVDSNGNPIVDGDGNSTRGPDGLPLVDDAGVEVEPVAYTPNGTAVPLDAAGGTFVLTDNGTLLLDANGNPVVVPAGGKPPPTNATVGDVLGMNLTLPDGTPASGLQVATCMSPLPFADPAAACPGDPAAVAVCLSPDQLQPPANATAAAAPLGVPLPGCANITRTFYHQFFPGTTVDGAIARQDETLEQMSDAAGGKPVSVVEWKVVYGEDGEDGEDAADAGGSRRRLAQIGGQSPIGVMGYFLIQDGDVADLQSVVGVFSGVGETIDENGRPILSQRQTNDIPICNDETSVANAWILGVMAVIIGVLLCVVIISMYMIRRARSDGKRAVSAGVLDVIAGDHSSNTITPSGRGPWSDRELIAASPRSGSRASGSNPFASSPHAAPDDRVAHPGPYSKVAAGSFGSTIGGTVRIGEGDSGSGSHSHSSGSGERTEGDSKASLGKSMLTLRDGIGGSRRRLESLYAGDPPPELNSADSDGTGGQALVLPHIPDGSTSRSDSNSGGSGSGGTPGSGGGQSGSFSNGNGNGGNGNAAAAAAHSGSQPRPVSLESGFTVANAPLPPIAEHTVSQSEATCSDTNDSAIGGSSLTATAETAAAAAAAASSSGGDSAAAAAAAVAAAAGVAAGAASGVAAGAAAARSTPSGSLSSTSSASGPAAAAAVAAARPLSGSTSGSAAPASAPAAGSSGGTSNTFHTVSITSWDSSASALMSMRDVAAEQRSYTSSSPSPPSLTGPGSASHHHFHHTPASSSVSTAAGGGGGGLGSAANSLNTNSANGPPLPNPSPPLPNPLGVGASSSFGHGSAYPALHPTPTGPAFLPGGSSSAMERQLVSITQLGSIGILSNGDKAGGSDSMAGSISGPGSLGAQDSLGVPTFPGHTQSTAGPSSHGQSIAAELSQQSPLPMPTATKVGQVPPLYPQHLAGESTSAALFPAAASSWMFGSRGEAMDDMRPDQHTEAVQFNSAGMLDSFRTSSRGALRGHDDVDGDPDGDGDVEVTAESHSMTMPALPGGRGGVAAEAEYRSPPDDDDTAVAADSRQSLASPYHVMDGGDMAPDTSLLQSLNPPQHDRGMQSTAIGQGYDLLDSMGPLPDHAPMPLDYLDTGALISVPQQPATGSPSSSAHLLTSVSMTRHESKGHPMGHTPGHSGPVAADGRSGMSSEDGTGRLNVPASLEEMLASQSQADESAFRSIDTRNESSSHSHSHHHGSQSHGGHSLYRNLRSLPSSD